jgi:hypothetical protein
MVQARGALYLTGGFNGVRYVSTVYRLGIDVSAPRAVPTEPPDEQEILALPALPELPYVEALLAIAGGALLLAVGLMIRERFNARGG